MENSLELARVYLLPWSRQEPKNQQKLAKLLQELGPKFGDKSLRISSEQELLYRAQHQILQGQMHHHILPGERSESLHRAELAYYCGLTFIDSAIAVQVFPYTVIDWVRLLIQNHTFFEYEEKAIALLQELTNFVVSMNPSSAKDELSYAIKEIHGMLEAFKKQMGSLQGN